VCNRDGRPDAIEAVLRAIKTERPGLRPHGFRLQLTALSNPDVRDNLERSDSMAWGFGAWKTGRDANSLEAAMRFRQRVQERLAAWNRHQPGAYMQQDGRRALRTARRCQRD